ncbi:hypothetical protein G9A89_006267 [Geosiphon pyriformis]|nr:hypothetical protein G9A89_006267 [Geosiphon pyriformis]
MSKKKTPKGAFYDPAGGSFLQKKKIVLGNVKHSGNKKDISLNKSELGNNVFSNMDSLSGNEKSINITDINVESLLNLAANTLKAKYVNIGAVFGFPFGSSNFDINNNEEVSLFPCFSISLNKKWVNPKITLNISAVEKKSVTAKTQLIRKIFSTINGFGEKSLIKATSLARKKEIIINSDLKKQEICSDWTVIIKEIPMNMPKKMIVTVVSEFDNIKLIKIQLIGIICRIGTSRAIGIKMVIPYWEELSVCGYGHRRLEYLNV